MRRWTSDLLLGLACSALSGCLLWTLRRAPTTPPARTASSTTGQFAALATRAERVTSYEIDAKLDARLHRIEGRETIRFVNRSSVALNELWFHLYLNAFKNDKTLFLRSPFGTGRSGDKAREYGYVDVKKLSVAGGDGSNLWDLRDRHSPSDPDDETDLRVPLGAALEPGATLTLTLEFEDQLPEIVERTGYSGSFHFVAQWFPKLARLEPDGRFAHFAFHAQSEFYADFGDYEVRLDVPSAYRVGATGALASESQTKGRRILQYHAENVHDFAWTAWDHFESRRARIAGTDVTVLYPPHQEANAEAELESVRFALPRFNRLYGDYPYPTLTLVHPPESAANAGGMEYPTLITTGGPWYSTYGGGHFIELVTTHELGHQWFYGLVASNEHTEPYLDEGVNSYAEAEALEARYGAGSVFAGFGFAVNSHAVNRIVSTTRAADEQVLQGAAEFATFRSLGALVYSRTALVLATLANVYGRDRMNHALGVYTRRFRFQHPTSADFLSVMREELDDRAAELLRLAFSERGTVDFLVRDISNAPVMAAAGVFDGPNGREKKAAPEAHAAGEYETRVVVYRHGRLQLPVDIELVFEDGSRQLRHWDGAGPTINIDTRAATPLVSVYVDPEQRILIDDDLSNNRVSTQRPETPRSFSQLLYGAQVLLGALGP
jgi:hypothetical protein